MNRIINFILVAALAVFFVGSPVVGQDDPVPPDIDRHDFLPEELREKIHEYRQEKHALRSELRALIDDLTDPTREQVQETVAAFREDHEDRIAAQRDLAREIREGLRDVRDDRPPRPRPDELPDAIKDLRNQFHDNQQDLRDERRTFIDSLGDLTEEQREAAIEQFREDHRAALQEQKDLRRQIRDAIRDEFGGDRRPDDGS